MFQRRKAEEQVLVDFQRLVKAHAIEGGAAENFVVERGEQAGVHQIVGKIPGKVGKRLHPPGGQGLVHLAQEGVHPEKADVRPLFQGRQGRVIKAGVHPVVRVHELHVPPLGGGKPGVAGGAGPAVFLVDDPHAAILSRQPVAQGGGIVGGAVVHQDQLGGFGGLVKDAGRALFQRGGGVVHRHDDAQQQFAHALASFLPKSLAHTRPKQRPTK